MLRLWEDAASARNPYGFIAGHFKVSIIVAARRALDIELINKSDFTHFYKKYAKEEWQASQGKRGGGNFWSNQVWRVGPRFAAAVVRAVKEGRLPYTEAYSLTGLVGKTFEDMPEKLELSL